VSPRRLAAAAAGVVLALLVAKPAFAHGIGGRSDLPLPVWLFAYGAGGAVLVSFAALGLLWPVARMDHEVVGRPLPHWADGVVRALAVVARVVGLAGFVVVLVAGVAGENDPAFNLAPTAVYVFFWVGLQGASALLGDVWKSLSPFDTLAAAGAWVRRRVTGRPSRGTVAEPAWGVWPAAALLLGFLWLELVHPDAASPRVLAVAMLLYSATVLTGASLWGRDWLRRGEAFGVWFALLARMAPLHRHNDGRLRIRPPLAGLAALAPVTGTGAVVLVTLGATTFDGLERTRFWADLVGSRTEWEAVPLNTLGFLWTIGLVSLAFFGAMRAGGALAGRDHNELSDWFVHSLVPIGLAYAVAHYFSLLVFQGQAGIALLSDPLGRGWDLFGTATRAVDFTAVSTRTIAWVQAGAIVVGHVSAVLLAHDRSVARFDRATATRSQYPLLAAMVLYTVGGLAILLGG
jgi:hypothetical protein